jgi:predicted ATPase/DNA-binding SARP family transcriptional activator
MDYRVLGSFEAQAGDEPISLGGFKQRALLALLVLNANEVVGRDRLIDDLWGDHPPETAVQSVQVYVSRLRKLLPDDTLLTRPAGYLLAIEPDTLDLRRFERLLADGREALAGNDADNAARVLREALELWRGPALAEFAFEPFAQAEIGRLEDLRVTAVEERIEADLALGRHADLIGELEALIAEHPHRERLRGQLMLALYRSGRQVEALGSYQQAREHLREDLGIDPSHDLQTLYKQILNQEQVLTLAAQPRAPRTNLPASPNRLIGRAAESAAISALILGHEMRLLTLTGPGGTGKTRLALEVAHEIAEHVPGGVFWVSLAPVRDASLVLTSVAQALEVSEAPGEQLVDTIASRLLGKRSLVVLDNAEHLLPEIATQVALLRDGCPTLSLLVTSRERLRLKGERVRSVPPLEKDEAVDLFLTRAADAGVELAATPAVGELCERLDELPLALELAAARTVVFSVEQLLERISERLDLLKGGRDTDPRQQTLRATLDWSYRLLTPQEQRLFRAMSVFPGGTTYEGAAEVGDADPDTLQSLLEKSLLRRRDTGLDPRYWMLETIREYASLRLDATRGARETRRRHAEYCLALAERAAHDLAQGDASRWRWLERLDADLPNLRAMLKWLEHEEEDGQRVRAAAALWRYWVVRDAAEGLPWLQSAAMLGTEDDARGHLLHGLAVIAMRLGMLDVAQEAALERADWHRLRRDERGYADSLVLAGGVATDLGNFVEARSSLETAAEYARDAGDRTILAGALTTLGYVALREGEYDEAIERSLEAAPLWRDLNRDDQVPVTLINLSSAFLAKGDIDAARATLHESLQLAVALGNSDHIAYCLDGLAAVGAADGDAHRAALLLGVADTIRKGTGTTRESYEREIFERTQATARETLGDAYDSAVAAGRGLKLEDAVAYALAENR